MLQREKRKQHIYCGLYWQWKAGEEGVNIYNRQYNETYSSGIFAR